MFIVIAYKDFNCCHQDETLCLVLGSPIHEDDNTLDTLIDTFFLPQRRQQCAHIHCIEKEKEELSSDAFYFMTQIYFFYVMHLLRVKMCHPLPQEKSSDPKTSQQQANGYQAKHLLKICALHDVFQ